MTKQEKQVIAKGLTGERLVELYDSYGKVFDPLNADYCETYEVLKDEIIRRCVAGEERNG